MTEQKKTVSKKKAVKKKTVATDNTSGKRSVNSVFDEKKQYKKRHIYKIFTEFFEKAGVEKSPKNLNKKIIIADVIIMALLSLAIIAFSIAEGSDIVDVLTILALVWTVVLICLYLLSLLAVFIYLDLKIYSRTKQIEEVLPDFLQLTSANISAGMTIERALWFAVRPRFGVLANEIENVAKATITGGELETELSNLTKKYNSRILKEAIELINAGIKSGGELGELLNNISENITQTRLMKKEISASVTTYIIFIAVAAVVAAPLLFALSGQLLVVIGDIAQSFEGDSGGGSGALSLTLNADSVSLDDFNFFSLTLLGVTSFFASAIISSIRKGNAKEGLKNVPLFFVVSFAIYLLSKMLLGSLLGGLF
ncbi:MAG: type II secretion system F family protein [Candidatus Woesearchaeota archaeon]